jgi:hypothetical protein
MVWYIINLLNVRNKLRIYVMRAACNVFAVVALLLQGCAEQEGDVFVTEIAERKESVKPEVSNISKTKLRADEISKPEVKVDINTDYQTIEWTDLMPEEDLNALLNPPRYITEAKEGSFEDQISSGLKSAMASEIDDAYQRALVSESVVLKYDRQAIRLAGFVVPLEFNDENVISEFFLVPFFGACVHVPAPPPNQIIFVKHSTGFKLDVLYNPIWVSGVLSVSVVENDIATSAYSLNMTAFEPYKEAD